MKKVKYVTGLWILMAVSCMPVFSQGYDIRLSINCCRNDTVMMGHYFTKSEMMYPDDTTMADRSGHAVFRGKEKLAKGVYFFIGDRRKLTDFIVGNEQKFAISTDTSDVVGKAQCKDSRDNEIFLAFQRMNQQKGIRLHELRQEYEAADSASKREVAKKLQGLNDERFDEIWRLMQESEGLYVHKFLNSFIPTNMRVPVEKPEKPWQNPMPEGSSSWTADSISLYRYHWYRSHYFDDLNLLDPDMLRTPLYESKLMDYFTKTIPQLPDSINATADRLLAAAQPNTEMFRYILMTLWNHYINSKVMAHENVWVHLADRWCIPYATWLKPDYVETIRKEAEKRKFNMIGEPAPPMEMLTVLPPDHFKAAKADTAIKFDLYAGRTLNDFRKSLKGKYTAIFFWDSHCSHCQKAIKELHAEYEKLKDKGLVVITVMTVNTKDAKGKWIDFVNDNNLFGWTNAWSPYSAEYRSLYDISSTPQLFLLDEDEKIIGKRLVPEQLELFIK